MTKIKKTPTIHLYRARLAWGLGLLTPLPSGDPASPPEVTRLFRTVPSANTLVRWVNKNAFAFIRVRLKNSQSYSRSSRNPDPREAACTFGNWSFRGKPRF
jgi:hypothetical protein